MVAINDKNIYILRLSVIYDDPVYLKLSDRYFIEINVSCWKGKDLCLIKDNQLCLKFYSRSITWASLVTNSLGTLVEAGRSGIRGARSKENTFEEHIGCQELESRFIL